MDSWIPKSPGWLTGGSQANRKEEKPVDPDQSEYGVRVKTLKCPRLTPTKCGSRNLKLYKAMPWVQNERVLYYRCIDCGHNFKVTEVDA